jgi:hypothetical protein
MGKQVAMSTIRMEVENVTTAPEFHVTEAGKVVGDLRVSKGGAFWRSKGAQQYMHLTWEQVDQLFKEKVHGANSRRIQVHAPCPGHV